MRIVTVSLALLAANLFTPFNVLCQDTVEPSLTDLAEGANWAVFNRKVSAVKDGERSGVMLDAKPGDGVAWLADFQFTNGVIDLDLKGKDVQGRSFIGVAFHGVDEKTYDAVYFRPFNFRSTDPARRSHAMQYISHPVYTWNKLRTEHPDVYENELAPPPDPTDWFHARLVIDKPKVSVFVNNAKEPSLVVEQLSDRKGGWVGLWVGNGSDGSFANLIITRRD